MDETANRQGKRERMSREERRSVVLDAAIVEFASYGLHGATTDSIARRVGVSQPYIIRLFGSKKGLFLQSGQRVFDRIMEKLRSSVQRQPDRPLRALRHAYISLMTQREELLMLIQVFAASKDPEVLDTVHRRLEELYVYVQEVTGETEENLRLLFAQSMLLTVAASIDLYSLAEEKDWARTVLGSDLIRDFRLSADRGRTS